MTCKQISNKNMKCMIYLKRNRKLTSTLGCLPRSSKLKSKIDSPRTQKTIRGYTPLAQHQEWYTCQTLPHYIIEPKSLASNIICIGSNISIRHLLLSPQ